MPSVIEVKVVPPAAASGSGHYSSLSVLLLAGLKD